MPELPEVEACRRRIAGGARNRTIPRLMPGKDTMGLAGFVQICDSQDGRPAVTRLVVAFEGDRCMAFRAPRTFGRSRVVASPEDVTAARDPGCVRRDGTIDKAGTGGRTSFFRRDYQTGA